MYRRLWCRVLLGADSQAGAGYPQQPSQESTAAAAASARGEAQGPGATD